MSNTLATNSMEIESIKLKSIGT